jgi:hypothetical protein
MSYAPTMEASQETNPNMEVYRMLLSGQLQS